MDEAATNDNIHGVSIIFNVFTNDETEGTFIDCSLCSLVWGSS